jgi:hypothetical protein
MLCQVSFDKLSLDHITPRYNNLGHAKPGYAMLGQVNSG